MAFRKNKNLRNYLVRAKLKTNPHDNHTQNLPDINLQIEHQPPLDNPTIDPFHTPDDFVSFCPIRSCFLHKYLNKSLKIHCTITNRSFRIRGTFNCNSKHIIYLMQCNKCKKQYIGQTSTCLRHRTSQHINNKQSSNSTVDQHFCQPGHSFSVQPIEQIQISSGDSPSTIRDKLYTREAYWINKLKTVYPQGLNWTPGRTINKHPPATD